MERIQSTFQDQQLTKQEIDRLDANFENSVYVADLPRSASYMDLQQLFEGIGKCEITMKRPQEKFYSAFVTFATKAQGKHNMDHLPHYSSESSR